MRKTIAIAPGDPAGIGYEIAVKALAEPSLKQKWMQSSCVPIVYANAQIWMTAVQMFAPHLEFVRVSDASAFITLPSTAIGLADTGIDAPNFRNGQPDKACAQCAYRALMMICRDVRERKIDGICTGPIHKLAMRMADISDIGHTEILANAFDVSSPMTLFITNSLRIFFYSRHLSLRQAIDALNIEGIVSFGRQMHREMQQLGFRAPHLAMAGLNPHASDGGQFGHEERDIIQPASARLRQSGVDISDPIGADSVFAQAASGNYDAVLSLYHDQGHIAAKTYDFERTISATLGLPVLRTSVDHGTAMDIAYQGKAQSISMQTAIEKLIEFI